MLNSSRGVTGLISTRYVYSGPPFFRWSDNGDHEITVARRVESNVTIGPDAIVISRNLARVLGEEPNDRVERRADLTGEHANIVGLPLLGVKRERINIPRFFDHSVECDRRRERSGAIVGVVGLGLDRVAKRAEPKHVRVGCVTARIVRQKAKIAIGMAGQIDLGRGFAQHVADPANAQMLAQLATGRERGGRPWEVSDMQAVQALRIAGERRLAHGDDVRPVFGGDQRNEAILPDEGVVIARGQLEPLRVQDRDIRVE